MLQSVAFFEYVTYVHCFGTDSCDRTESLTEKTSKFEAKSVLEKVSNVLSRECAREQISESNTKKAILQETENLH